MDKNLLEKTDTEKTIELTKANGMIKVDLTVKGVLITSVIQTMLGALMVNYTDQSGPFKLLIPFGLMMMCLGIAGTLIYSADLMKVDKRDKMIRALKGKR